MSSRAWIIEWFVANSPVDRAVIEAGSASSYFEQGWIDSMTFIRFITDLEASHDVRFKNEDFQDRAFSTIDGLAALLDARTHGAR